ncbi:MAG: apolipoprotein N-acyltransferase [Polaromonas sp.]|nr:apolipoprotein N-acyltransferase [Polaromonas sp.]
MDGIQSTSAPQTWRWALLVSAAGLAHAASIAWPLPVGSAVGLDQGQPLWWLQIAAMAGLFVALNRATSVRQGAWLGWLFATALQCGTWWWLFTSLHTYGGLAWPLSVLAIVALAGFLGLYYAVVCGLYMRLTHSFIAWRAIVFASFWLMAELARVQFFTGFPWGEGGYAQLDGPFDNLAKLVGVHGLTWGAALLAATLAGLALNGQGRMRALLGLLLAVGAALGLSSSLRIGADGDQQKSGVWAFSAPLPAAKPFTVTLLQGNISQDEKFKGGTGIPDALNWYGRQLLAANTALIVTPETALPLLPEQLPLGYVDTLTDRFTSPPQAGTPPTAALIGIPLGSSADGYTNSVIGLQPGLAGAMSAKPVVYRYDKHHLVPFGEFVHPLFKWFLALVNIPLSDFNTGPVSQPSFAWQGQRIAPNICYEDLFGEELAVRFTDPTQAPTMFVNISNIAWFGDSVAIDQHLNISRLRAIEFERPMLRATNTGATAVIDYRGQVTHSLPRLTRGSLQAEVQGRTGITPYAWWVGRLGLWPWWTLCSTVLILAWIRARRP